jgi:hypothetical protein
MSHQPSLFGFDSTGAAVAPTASVQSRELARVSGRIAESVLLFLRRRQKQTFRAADLAAFVMADSGGAPASADRVLRQLRAQGHVDVEVVDRAASLYRVNHVGA